MTEVQRANIEALLASTLQDHVRVITVSEPIPQADRNAVRVTVIFEIDT